MNILEKIKNRKIQKNKNNGLPVGIPEHTIIEERDVTRQKLLVEGYILISDFESKKAIILALNEGIFPLDMQSLIVSFPSFVMGELDSYNLEVVQPNINDLPSIIDLGRNNILKNYYQAIGTDLYGIDFYYLPIAVEQ